jgi:hypothetical protein
MKKQTTRVIEDAGIILICAIFLFLCVSTAKAEPKAVMQAAQKGEGVFGFSVGYGVQPYPIPQFTMPSVQQNENPSFWERFIDWTGFSDFGRGTTRIDKNGTRIDTLKVDGYIIEDQFNLEGGNFVLSESKVNGRGLDYLARYGDDGKLIYQSVTQPDKSVFEYSAAMPNSITSYFKSPDGITISRTMDSEKGITETAVYMEKGPVSSQITRVNSDNEIIFSKERKTDETTTVTFPDPSGNGNTVKNVWSGDRLVSTIEYDDSGRVVGGKISPKEDDPGALAAKLGQSIQEKETEPSKFEPLVDSYSSEKNDLDSSGKSSVSKYVSEGIDSEVGQEMSDQYGKTSDGKDVFQGSDGTWYDGNGNVYNGKDERYLLKEPGNTELSGGTSQTIDSEANGINPGQTDRWEWTDSDGKIGSTRVTTLDDGSQRVVDQYPDGTVKERIEKRNEDGSTDIMFLRII